MLVASELACPPVFFVGALVAACAEGDEVRCGVVLGLISGVNVRILEGRRLAADGAAVTGLE